MLLNGQNSTILINLYLLILMQNPQLPTNDHCFVVWSNLHSFFFFVWKYFYLCCSGHCGYPFNIYSPPFHGAATIVVGWRWPSLWPLSNAALSPGHCHYISGLYSLLSSVFPVYLVLTSIHSPVAQMISKSTNLTLLLLCFIYTHNYTIALYCSLNKM